MSKRFSIVAAIDAETGAEAVAKLAQFITMAANDGRFMSEFNKASEDNVARGDFGNSGQFVSVSCYGGIKQ